MSQQIDIADILGQMQAGPVLGPTRNKIGELLKYFSRGGLTLAVCADKRHLGRKVSTLKRYACEHSLVFPDYCPRHLKPKKEKKKKKGATA